MSKAVVEAIKLSVPDPISLIGQPRDTNTPEKLLKQVKNYLTYCQEMKENPTVSGMAFYIGVDPRTLIKWQNEESTVMPGTGPILKDAKDYIFTRYEQNLVTKQVAAGTIFAMKNWFGWKDVQTFDHKHSGSIDINLSVEEIKTIQGNQVIDIKAELGLVSAVSVKQITDNV